MPELQEKTRVFAAAGWLGDAQATAICSREESSDYCAVNAHGESRFPYRPRSRPESIGANLGYVILPAKFLRG
jgi:hypothetical protein